MKNQKLLDEEEQGAIMVFKDYEIKVAAKTKEIEATHTPEQLANYPAHDRAKVEVFLQRLRDDVDKMLAEDWLKDI